MNIPLSEAEQASFFGKWGNDINSLISHEFENTNLKLDRLIFLQESVNFLDNLTIKFQLRQLFSEKDIGHFRTFCLVCLEEPVNNLSRLLFGSSDKAFRFSPHSKLHSSNDPSGIEIGISSGIWHSFIDYQEKDDQGNTRLLRNEDFTLISDEQLQGLSELNSISITYRITELKSGLNRIRLRDLDSAKYLPFVNRLFADKILSIHIYANGYKLKEIELNDFMIH